MALLHCELYSRELRMPTSLNLILPQDTTGLTAPAKTLYLLHGRSHNYSVWQRYTSLERYCESRHVAVVMPEANRSFYTDMAYGVNYFSYIAEELPRLCESMFHISTRPGDRYIAGISMGGYGCLKAALSFPENYAACFPISAVTDIRLHIADTPEDSPKKNEFRGIFGPEFTVTEQDDLYALAHSAQSAAHRPDFHFLCGTEDHLYREGKAFQEYLRGLRFGVSSREWPGVHDWAFWDAAIARVIRCICP